MQLAQHARELGDVPLARFRQRFAPGEFQTLVQPGVPVPPFIAVLTGITDSMLIDAPPLSAAAAGRRATPRIGLASDRIRRHAVDGQYPFVAGREAACCQRYDRRAELDGSGGPGLHRRGGAGDGRADRSGPTPFYTETKISPLVSLALGFRFQPLWPGMSGAGPRLCRATDSSCLAEVGLLASLDVRAWRLLATAHVEAIAAGTQSAKSSTSGP